MKATQMATATVAASLGTLMLALSAPASAADEPYSVSANIGVVSNYMWRGVTQTLDGAAVQGGLDFTHESGFYAGTWASNVDFNDEGAPQEVIIPVDPATGMPATDADGNILGTTSGSSNPSSPNYELDLYLGYGGKINDDLGWNLKAIYYAYPDGRDSNFAELDGSMTWKWITLGLAYTVYGQNDDGLFDNGDIYYYGGFEFGDLPFGLSFSVRGGYYDFNNSDIVVGTAYDPATNQLVDVTDTADYWNYGASISKDAGDFGTFSLNWDQNSGKSDVGYDNDPKFWVGWLKEF